MGIKKHSTVTVSGEWILKGSTPTVGELIAVAHDLRSSGIPREIEVHYEPPYSDIQSYPARMFIKPFEIPVTIEVD